MAASRFGTGLFWQGLGATDHESSNVIGLADRRVLMVTQGFVLVLQLAMARRLTAFETLQRSRRINVMLVLRCDRFFSVPKTSIGAIVETKISSRSGRGCAWLRRL